jgi:hypothetical protein
LTDVDELKDVYSVVIDNRTKEWKVVTSEEDAVASEMQASQRGRRSLGEKRAGCCVGARRTWKQFSAILLSRKTKRGS